MNQNPDALVPSPYPLERCKHCGSPAYMIHVDVTFTVKCTNGDCQIATPPTVFSKVAAQIWNRAAAPIAQEPRGES